MSILLPRTPGVRAAKPAYRDFGLTLNPALGGVAQRLDRLGSRWSLTIELPPIGEGAPLRAWNAALLLARSQGAQYPVIQPGYATASLSRAPGLPGNFSYSFRSSVSIAILGMAPGTVLPAATLISILSGGVRYSYYTTGIAIAGAAYAELTTNSPPLAVHQAGDLVQLFGGATVISVAGTLMTLSNTVANQTIAAGSFVSVTHGTRRYLHMVTADVATGDGTTVIVPISPLPRAPYGNGDPAELVTPCIEGLLSGNGFDWQYGLDPYVSQSFTIDEVA